MPSYAFPAPVHTDADNLPGQAFAWEQHFSAIDLTGYTATMTIDGVAVNLPCTVSTLQIGANLSSKITLTTVLGTVTNTWLPGVYAYRVTVTAPDATTAVVAYGNLLELTPRQGSTYGTVGPAGPAGPPGPSTGVSPSTLTAAPFVQPASAATVSVQVQNSSYWVAGQAVFADQAGYYIVDSIPDATHLVLLNLDAPGCVLPGVTIPSGTRITSSGLPGTGTEQRITTTNATPTLLEFDVSWMAPLTTWRMTAVVVARSASGRKSFVLEGLFSKDINGTVTQDGGPEAMTSVLPSTSPPPWTGSMDASSGGTKVGLTLTGAAATNIFWSALAQVVRTVGEA